MDPESDYEKWKAETLALSHAHLRDLVEKSKGEPPKPMLDLTGTRRIPKFRDRGPEEVYQDYDRAFNRAALRWCRTDRLRRDLERHEGVIAEVVPVSGSDGCWRIDWVTILRGSTHL